MKTNDLLLYAAIAFIGYMIYKQPPKAIAAPAPAPVDVSNIPEPAAGEDTDFY